MHPQHDNLRKVNKGRPTLPLPNLITLHKNIQNNIQDIFAFFQYEMVGCFTGCHTTNKLYCWSCLLFSSKHEASNEQCFSDLNPLSRAQQKHAKPQTRVHCYLQLQLLGKQQRVELLIDAQRRNDVTRHNESVKKRRWKLRQFIGAFFF